MKLKDYENAETTNIDFKEKVELNKPKSWLKSVSAFANSTGGVLLFGVRDSDHFPMGVDNISEASEKITELINSKIVPIPRYELNVFCENEREFLVIKVGDGPKTPYYYKSDGGKEAFIRSGNQSISAPKHILDNLILKSQNTTFDELSSKYCISDMSFTLLNATLKEETGKSLEQKKDYISLELSVQDKLTNAGLLLSDQGLLPQSKIFCTRWNGLKKGNIVGDAIDDKEYSGSILSLLQNSELFVKNYSKLSWKIVGKKRIEIEDYPLRAVREAIVNAIIHRDYQILGSEIHIDMFDDRLEIVSPGGMIDGSCVQDLDISQISSIRRNRIISDIFNRLNLMERRGSGLVRILDSYQDFEKKPSFYSTSSFFKVTFPNKGYMKEVIEQEDSTNFEWENNFFIVQLHKKLPKNMRLKTYDQVETLFLKFRYNQIFGREDIVDLLRVQKSRAGDLLSVLLKCELIEQVDFAKYRFKQ